ncbi:MAG: phage tail tube protein [Jannaschia sp.]
MPQFWRKKIILAKTEVTYAVDPLPLAANGILAVDVTLSGMDGNDVARNLDLPFLGAQGTVPTALHQKLSFKVELAGSGIAGTAPKWGPLLRACACAQTIVATTSVTYNPVSDAHESVTFYIWIDSTLYAIPGSRGTVKLNLTTQAIPYLEFEFTGLYRVPAETARITPDLAGYVKPQVVSKANTPLFTLNGQALTMRDAMLDLGNAVEPRFLVGQGAGAESIIITQRQDVFTCRVEAVPVTTFNPYALAAAATQVPVVLTHGTVAGNRATLNIPRAQMQRPQGLENAQDIVEWPLRMEAVLGAAGNDQWTLVLT